MSACDSACLSASVFACWRVCLHASLLWLPQYLHTDVSACLRVYVRTCVPNCICAYLRVGMGGKHLTKDEIAMSNPIKKRGEVRFKQNQCGKLCPKRFEET